MPCPSISKISKEAIWFGLKSSTLTIVYNSNYLNAKLVHLGPSSPITPFHPLEIREAAVKSNRILGLQSDWSNPSPKPAVLQQR